MSNRTDEEDRLPPEEQWRIEVGEILAQCAIVKKRNAYNATQIAEFSAQGIEMRCTRIGKIPNMKDGEYWVPLDVVKQCRYIEGRKAICKTGLMHRRR